MARGVEPGALKHAGDLVPKVRHRARGAGIGGRGEEPDDAQFALKLAFGVQKLHPDIIEINAAVDFRFYVRFGDEKWCRFFQEGADFGRHHHEFLATAQNLDIGVAQDAETFRGDRVGEHIRLGEAIFADAEEGEIVRQQPVEKLHGFGDLIRRQQRRVGAKARRDLGHARAHRQPVGHCGADVSVNGFEARVEVRLLGGIHGIGDMNVEEALPLHGRQFPPARGANEARQCAGGIPLQREDGMGDQRHRPTAFTQFCQRRG